MEGEPVIFSEVFQMILMICVGWEAELCAQRSLWECQELNDGRKLEIESKKPVQ